MESWRFNSVTGADVLLQGTNSSSSPSPFCQVHGCNKKLVSCKDYYKRHKVCEFHSKSTQVIVNGIQQRFCQQCSRFHILSEFDIGKRSCRRRLADHNQRRRKPYGIAKDANSKLKGSTRLMATLPSIWHVELENEIINDLRSMSSVTDIQLQYPYVHETVDPYDILNDDPTPALSSLPSQSDGASSCHSSRNPQMIELGHTVHQASCSSSNMNPLEGSNSMNQTTQVWSNDEPTIDLLQLSSELERVEHQKEIIHKKCAEWF